MYMCTTISSSYNNIIHIHQIYITFFSDLIVYVLGDDSRESCDSFAVSTYWTPGSWRRYRTSSVTPLTLGGRGRERERKGEGEERERDL